MPEAPIIPLREIPLAGRTLAMPGGRLAIAPAPATSRHVLRCLPGDAARVGDALGITLPLEACRSQVSGATAVLWLGPDEWLLVGHDRAERIPVAGIAISLVDVSHRSVALEIDGSGAEDVLASDCPLDLSRAAFVPGTCTRTVFCKCEIVLWRKAADTFWLDVTRSRADYVWGLLEMACADVADLRSRAGELGS
jgi:sarcosine oxidase subunit gamma